MDNVCHEVTPNGDMQSLASIYQVRHCRTLGEQVTVRSTRPWLVSIVSVAVLTACSGSPGSTSDLAAPTSQTGGSGGQDDSSTSASPAESDAESPDPSPSEGTAVLSGQELADLLPPVEVIGEIVDSRRLAEIDLYVEEGTLGWPTISAVRPKACLPLVESSLFYPSEDPKGDALGFVNAVWADKSVSSALDGVLSGRPVYMASVLQYGTEEDATAAMNGMMAAAPECLQFNVVTDDGSSPQTYLEVDVDESSRTVGLYGNFGVFTFAQVDRFLVGTSINRGLDESMLEVETLGKLTSSVIANVEANLE